MPDFVESLHQIFRGIARKDRRFRSRNHAKADASGVVLGEPKLPLTAAAAGKSIVQNRAKKGSVFYAVRRPGFVGHIEHLQFGESE